MGAFVQRAIAVAAVAFAILMLGFTFVAPRASIVSDELPQVYADAR
jgi:hypothetical protein